MIKIDQCNAKIDTTKIERFEREIGKELPKDYYKFLLKYNGGIPEDNIYENSDISIAVQFFYGLGLNGSGDINHKIKVLEDRIAKECVPIAEIEGGDVLCIVLSKERYGQILLWEHEEELNEGYTDNISMLKKVTLTFKDFMKKLQSFDTKNDDDNFKIKDIWIDPEFLKELGNN